MSGIKYGDPNATQIRKFTNRDRKGRRELWLTEEQAYQEYRKFIDDRALSAYKMMPFEIFLEYKKITIM